jgi:hypothetical protein
MANQNFCPIHGPYDAAYASCPFCSSGGQPLPSAPPSLDDEMPTDVGGGYAAGGGVPPSGGFDSEAPTEYGGGSGSGSSRRGRPLDDDMMATELGKVHVSDATMLENPEVGPLAILWVREGTRRGRIYKVLEETVVGRSQGDLVLDDPKVSNPHAKIVYEKGQFVIWDFGSKNGTYVNGSRIRAATALKENDIVKMGDLICVLKILDLQPED